MPDQLNSEKRLKGHSNTYGRRDKSNPSTAPSSPCSSSVSSSSSQEQDAINLFSKKSLLEQCLLEIGCYEVDCSHRRRTLDHIESILSKWAETLGSQKLIDASQITRVALIPFGSYRLGVQRPESDLDVLALAPQYCTRSDFFTSLVHMLADDSRVSQLHPIASAYTPVIKFVVDTLQIDLVFSRTMNTTKLLNYHLQRVNLKAPRDFLTNMYKIDDSDLLGLDEAGVRSLNGARVSQILLESVQPFCSLDVYRTVLIAVKQWAVKKGIYSNVLGFLGGINWTILVAFVCRNYQGKKKNPQSLLRSFFITFASWTWPNPVMLAQIQNKPPLDSIPYLPAWNPAVNPRDGLHVMPIITPAYPSMNSSYNVGPAQLRRIQDEMVRAANLLSQQPHNYMALLMNESDFFTRHIHFVQINIRARNKQDFVEWFRLVESRLRLLIGALETPYVQAWPFAKFFVRKYNTLGICVGALKQGESTEDDCLHERCFFIGVRFAYDLERINLCHYTSDFLYKVNTWEGRKEGMDLSIAHVTQNNLPSFIGDEMRMSTALASCYGIENERVQIECHDPAIDSSSGVGIATSKSDVKCNFIASPLKKCRIMAKLAV